MMNYFVQTMPTQQQHVPYVVLCMNPQQQAENQDILQQLKNKCSRLERQNSELKRTIERLRKTNKRNYTKKRRVSHDLTREFLCPYEGCSKDYASDLALNLHIRNKHNGGTKTERQNLARLVVIAEQKGQAGPPVNLNFPPGFLQGVKIKLLKQE